MDDKLVWLTDVIHTATKSINIITVNHKSLIDELEAMPDASTWTRVDKALPEVGKKVIVAKIHEGGNVSIGFGRFYRDYPLFNPKTMRNEPGDFWSTMGGGDVRWWMEIPPVPEEGVVKE